MATTEDVENPVSSSENPEITQFSSEEAIEFFLRLEPNKSAREIFRELNSEELVNYGYANFMRKVVRPLEETELVTTKGERRGKKYFYGEDAFPVLKEISESKTVYSQDVPDLEYDELESDKKAVIYMVDNDYSFGEMSGELGFETVNETVEEMRSKNIIVEEDSYTNFSISANISGIPDLLEFEEDEDDAVERTDKAINSSLASGRTLSKAVMDYNDSTEGSGKKNLMYWMAKELQDKETFTYTEIAAEMDIGVERTSIVAEDLWDAGIADIGETEGEKVVRLKDEFRTETYFISYSNLE